MGCGASTSAAAASSNRPEAAPVNISQPQNFTESVGRPEKLPPAPPLTNGAYHVMLQHDWGDADELGRNNHESVRAVNEALKRRGLITWFDADRMTGNVLTQMTQAVDKSVVIACFITRRYLDKVGGDNPADNCLIEFGYAQRRKPGCLIAVPMEPRVRNPASWSATVGAALGNERIPAHFTDGPLSGAKFEENVDLLFTRIVSVVLAQKNSPLLESPEEVKKQKAAAFADTPSGGSGDAKSGADPATLGVSLAFFLYDFAAKHLTDNPGLANKDLVSGPIMEATAARKCRYTDLIEPQHLWATAAAASKATGEPVPKMYYISHAFGNPFELIVTSLRNHFLSDRDDPNNIFLWIDVFAINQHDPNSDLDGGRLIKTVIDNCEQTLVILDRDGTILKRLWCLMEFAWTSPDRLVMLAYGLNVRAIAKILQDVSAESAQCFSDLDKLVMHKHISSTFGSLAQFTAYLRALVGRLLAPEAIQRGDKNDTQGNDNANDAEEDKLVAQMEAEIRAKKAAAERRAVLERKRAELASLEAAGALTTATANEQRGHIAQAASWGVITAREAALKAAASLKQVDDERVRREALSRLDESDKASLGLMAQDKDQQMRMARRKAALNKGGRWAAECAVSLRFLLNFFGEQVDSGGTFIVERRGDVDDASSCHMVEVSGAELTTGEVVKHIIMKRTESLQCRYVELQEMSERDVWTQDVNSSSPFQFVSHAFGNPFSLVVHTLRERFSGLDTSEVFLWLDIFAINQWDTDADLNGGATLSDTIALSSHTVVVLDPGGLPLRRLWCLYEIGQTLRTALSADKLVLLAHGAEAAALAELVEEVDVSKAGCFDPIAARIIRDDIIRNFESEEALTEMLKAILEKLVVRAVQQQRPTAAPGAASGKKR